MAKFQATESGRDMAKTRRKEILGAVGAFVVLAIISQVLTSGLVSDWWRTLWYRPTAMVSAIEDELELTTKGWRIFASTQPVVEASEDFNYHCHSYDDEVSVIGCYVGGRIYIYEITLNELEAANTVTAAHELLHAAWERLPNLTKKRLTPILEQVYRGHREWFDEELETYDDDERIEEIYTRAGTKLAELPEKLERHYAEYFRNRQQIVAYYEAYEQPFKVLQDELDELETRILAEKAQLATERRQYEQRLMILDTKIDQFNACAEQAGCFQTDAEFQSQRQVLAGTQQELEKVRDDLNERISENNDRIAEYAEKSLQLGELHNSMNSNLTKAEEEI